MVDIFFIISGFALTYGVLGHMHNNQPDKVLDTLASSIFRRHMRLYLPLIFASFVTMLAIYTGIAIKGEEPDVLQPKFLDNVWFWIVDTVRSCDPFPHVVSWWAEEVRATHTVYIPQAWTIPVEFRGSMLVFVSCLALCRTSARRRMWITLISSAACFWWVTPYAGLFLYGMWLADGRHLRMRQRQEATILPLIAIDTSAGSQAPLDIEKQDNDAGEESRPQTRCRSVWSWLHRKEPDPSPSFPNRTPTFRQQLPYIILFCLSFVFLTAPDPDPMSISSPFPYNLLARTYPPTWKFKPAKLHWPFSIGAMMLCYALEHAPLLQRPLNTQFSQFLGELSFGFYIMHNTVAWTVCQRLLVPWQREVFGDEPLHQIPGYIVMTILVFWAAEGFRRVDVRCVRFTKGLQDILFTA